MHFNLLFRKVVKSFIQGFLPGIALKIFLILLPSILMAMSKIEGYTSLSGLNRRSAAKYYLFLFINVFLGSVITGTAFQQLNSFIHQSANKYIPLCQCIFLHSFVMHKYYEMLCSVHELTGTKQFGQK
jgi:Calcium-dependent channel, 7TM region, putative phosphate